jgi:hypothetical protein
MSSENSFAATYSKLSDKNAAKDSVNQTCIIEKSCIQRNAVANACLKSISNIDAIATRMSKKSYVEPELCEVYTYQYTHI